MAIKAIQKEKKGLVTTGGNEREFFLVLGKEKKVLSHVFGRELLSDKKRSSGELKGRKRQRVWKGSVGLFVAFWRVSRVMA